MESSQIVVGNFNLTCHHINTLVIGSGAASLNSAVSLHSMGQEDIVIATSHWGGGTSRNAGSDKQTYYKLSLCGDEPDSVTAMAGDLFAGRCMHGDIALCEAQGSIKAFMNLVALGVPFPHDKYGSWAGYKTDHDPRARATSAGPYTSRMMFEALASEVYKRNIKVLDKHHCVALLTDELRTKVTGAIAINTEEKDPWNAFVLFNSTNVVLGTGGPAGIYDSSVYPLSQYGSTGMALLAGASGQNLTESQFGIASVKFRWNLSGSYQQVIPRYFSTSPGGSDKEEFLNSSFPDFKTLLRAIFLKGYQWPFDPVKVSGYGSSLIDLLVYKEIEEKGREVYIDYTCNPTWKNGEIFDLSLLDSETYNYLERSRALKDCPVERLLAMNPAAVALYHDHGIDLITEPIQIAVCAQHNNGGLKGNIWWESNLRHLFPVGEVNGSHGVYRPGGSALNSGQVGSYRAAQYISRKYGSHPPEEKAFLELATPDTERILALAEKWMGAYEGSEFSTILSEIQKRMSASGGIIRNRKTIALAAREADRLVNELPGKIKASAVGELADSFRLFDLCITHSVYLEAIRTYIEMGGRSRGSYIVTDEPDDSGKSVEDSILNPEICLYDREIEKKILELKLKDGSVVPELTDIRDIPKQNLWFEHVWRDYLEDNWLES
jgi:succinate dehydrogenase/fumarate reductase flavoprotein subunit